MYTTILADIQKTITTVRMEGADSPVSGSETKILFLKAVFASPYLAGIAAFIALMTFASTMLYFQQANLVAEAFEDRGVRTAFFAKIDLVVNFLTVLLQVYLTARIVKWLGIGLALARSPCAMSA